MKNYNDLYCQWCGRKFVATKRFSKFSDQKCDECVRNNAPRGSRLRLHTIPKWLTKHSFSFMHDQCECNLFDHWGTDADGNLVTEPYAGNCEKCLAAAAEIAKRLNLKHSVTRPSWHAPWIDECVRITFYKPEAMGGSR